ncbi:hypothetical protein OAH59_03035 [Euryarchaeota archaeon]|nr:hypothetical protein [Euryarchaeota archaeon]
MVMYCKPNSIIIISLITLLLPFSSMNFVISNIDELPETSYSSDSTESDNNAISELTAGDYHNCYLDEEDAIYCWGRNNFGQLGDGTNIDSPYPVKVIIPNGSTATSLTAGHAHTCAILDNESLYCWGRNHVGQLGDGTTLARNIPVLVNLPSERTAISVSSEGWHGCAILDNSSLYCWGNNNYGQLGDNTNCRYDDYSNGCNGNSGKSTPVHVANLPIDRLAVSVITGNLHTCAILDNASLYCWGNNDNGQLGDGTGISTCNIQTGICSLEAVAVSLPSGHSVISIDAGGYFNCIILDNGSLHCWGSNQEGQLGQGSISVSVLSPIEVSLPSGRLAISVSAGHYHTCIVLSDYELYCFGKNDWGALGDGSYIGRTSPVRVSLPSGSNTTYVSAGEIHTCAEVDNNSIYCWGMNTYYQIGDGTTSHRNIPVAVSLTDTDDDGFFDEYDSFPQNSTEWEDYDNDGIGNNADLDDDNDNWSDIDEINCNTQPLDPSSIPLDNDVDLLCDLIDEDDDNDGFEDIIDWAPLDPEEWLDSDGNGIGDNTDNYTVIVEDDLSILDPKLNLEETDNSELPELLISLSILISSIAILIASIALFRKYKLE